jgi:hypothetical protein
MGPSSSPQSNDLSCSQLTFFITEWACFPHTSKKTHSSCRTELQAAWNLYVRPSSTALPGIRHSQCHPNPLCSQETTMNGIMSSRKPIRQWPRKDKGHLGKCHSWQNGSSGRCLPSKCEAEFTHQYHQKKKCHATPCA